MPILGSLSPYQIKRGHASSAEPIQMAPILNPATGVAYLETIEKALGVPIRPNLPQKIDLCNKNVLNLYQCLANYHLGTEFPNRTGIDTVPYMGGLVYLEASDLPVPHTLFDKNCTDREIGKGALSPKVAIAKSLIYSNSQIIADSIIFECEAILFESDRVLIEQSRSYLTRSLTTLAEYSDLIRQNIIIPVWMRPVDDIVFKKIHEIAKSHVSTLSRYSSSDYNNIVVIEDTIYRYVLSDGKFDLAFSINIPHDIINNRIIKYGIAQGDYEKKDFEVIRFLQGHETINVKVLSIEDIISIRKDCDIFHEWRILIRESIEEFHKNNDPSSKEFLRTFREKSVDLDKRLKEKYKKSNSVSTIFTENPAISVHGIAALTAAMMGNSSIAFAQGVSGLAHLTNAMRGKDVSAANSCRIHFKVFG